MIKLLLYVYFSGKRKRDILHIPGSALIVIAICMRRNKAGDDWCMNLRYQSSKAPKNEAGAKNLLDPSLCLSNYLSIYPSIRPRDPSIDRERREIRESASFHFLIFFLAEGVASFGKKFSFCTPRKFATKIDRRRFGLNFSGPTIIIMIVKVFPGAMKNLFLLQNSFRPCSGFLPNIRPGGNYSHPTDKDETGRLTRLQDSFWFFKRSRHPVRTA